MQNHHIPGAGDAAHTYPRQSHPLHPATQFTLGHRTELVIGPCTFSACHPVGPLSVRGSCLLYTSYH